MVNIDLHEDLRMGRILGYGGILVSSIYTFIEDHGHDAFYNRQFSPKEDDEPPIVLVSLNGRFQLQDDPSPSVVKWLQKRGQTRRRQQRQRKKGEEFLLRVAAHIRVPESYCSAKWKKANDMSHVMDTLKVLKEQWDRVVHDLNKDGDAYEGLVHRPLTLDIFTEKDFTTENEALLLDAIKSLDLFVPPPTDERDHARTLPIRLHRQTPLLDTVQSMSTADIFIPASSYLSTLASFFS